MKVAFVYDRVNKWGGAESVLMALHEMWPEAPLFTSVYDKSLAPWANDFEMRTSFLQNLPLPKNKHEYYPFLMGLAFETFNFEEFDVVISVTSEFAKAIITKPKTFHLCYCLTPTSYLWSGYDQYFSDKSEIYKDLTAPIVRYLRYYDKIVSNRPDSYLAISKTVQNRIKQYYNQESEVIYPPVHLASQEVVLRSYSNLENYFLIVCRLVPNKRVDLAIDAFNELGLQLKIVGTGRQETDLKSRAKKNIEFLGSLTSVELDRYYSNCRALIVPAEEDFGIVAVEAQSYGKPVIAYGKGGASETVVEGKTGWLFKKHDAQELVELIKRTDIQKLDSRDCIQNAKRFSKSRFLKEFEHLVDSQYRNYINNA